MTRIDEESLAMHIEVALASCPPCTAERFGSPERHERIAATGALARHVADRLACFEFTFSSLPQPNGQHSLFDGESEY